jgi:hypothetical protein
MTRKSGSNPAASAFEDTARVRLDLASFTITTAADHEAIALSVLFAPFCRFSAPEDATVTCATTSLSRETATPDGHDHPPARDPAPVPASKAAAVSAAVSCLGSLFRRGGAMSRIIAAPTALLLAAIALAVLLVVARAFAGTVGPCSASLSIGRPTAAQDAGAGHHRPGSTALQPNGDFGRWD